MCGPEIPLFVCEHIKNKGTASALNTGIRYSRGDFIKWLSSDDVLLPDAIENMIDYVKGWRKLFGSEGQVKTTNTIYYTDYHVIDQNGQQLRNFIEPVRNNTLDLWQYFYGNASTSLIHKNVFKRCGLFDETLAHSEDYEFWLRATQLYGVEMHRISIFTINYRNHPDQLTNKFGGQLDSFIKEKIRNQMEIKVS